MCIRDRHYGVLKPGQQFVRRGKTAPELHQLLERKGFKFQIAPNDYYRFGKDDDWPDPDKQPLICVYAVSYTHLDVYKRQT